MLRFGLESPPAMDSPNFSDPLVDLACVRGSRDLPAFRLALRHVQLRRPALSHSYTDRCPHPDSTRRVVLPRPPSFSEVRADSVSLAPHHLRPLGAIGDPRITAAAHRGLRHRKLVADKLSLEFAGAAESLSLSCALGFAMLIVLLFPLGLFHAYCRAACPASPLGFIFLLLAIAVLPAKRLLRIRFAKSAWHPPGCIPSTRRPRPQDGPENGISCPLALPHPLPGVLEHSSRHTTLRPGTHFSADAIYFHAHNPFRAHAPKSISFASAGCLILAMLVTIVMELAPPQPQFLLHWIDGNTYLRQALPPFGAVEFLQKKATRDDYILSIGDWAASYSPNPSRFQHVYNNAWTYGTSDLENELPFAPWRYLILPQLRQSKGTRIVRMSHASIEGRVLGCEFFCVRTSPKGCVSRRRSLESGVCSAIWRMHVR
jgi:hypothetical protein